MNHPVTMIAIAAPEPEQSAGSAIRAEFEMREQMFGPNPATSFMLKAGREFSIGPKSFDGPRGTPKQCYANAAHLALADPGLTYCEGLVHTIMPIPHAWCVDKDGVVVDPTLSTDGRVGSINGYYGVAFSTEYLKRCLVANKVYGLLDDYYARNTVEKLYELGLVAGQQWLLDMPVSKVRGLGRRRKA